MDPVKTRQQFDSARRRIDFQFLNAQHVHVRFFVGLHLPYVAKHFESSFISVNVIRNRKSGFPVNDWIMDSGAFSTIFKHGGYPNPVSEYASQVRRWKSNGNLMAAVQQDYMCEPAMLTRTGLTVRQHQILTIDRYDNLLAENTGVTIMPVLQGYAVHDYIDHIRQYGDRLIFGMWVGVGSVCKRNGDPAAIQMVLGAIKDERPDLLLHGFGLKKTSLRNRCILDMLHSADSMSWSFSARKQGRDPNDYREAQKFVRDIDSGVREASLQRMLSF